MSAHEMVAVKLKEWSAVRAEIRSNMPDGIACYCCGADSVSLASIGPLTHVAYGAFACPPCLRLIEQERTA